MTKEEREEALNKWEKWIEREKVTLNGVKEIRASRDAFLFCWDLWKAKKENGSVTTNY